MPRADMAARHDQGQKQRRIVLDAHPFQRVIAVRQPDPLRPPQNAEINPPAARSTAFNLHPRKGGAQPVQQRIGATGLRCVGMGQKRGYDPI